MTWEWPWDTTKRKNEEAKRNHEWRLAELAQQGARMQEEAEQRTLALKTAYADAERARHEQTMEMLEAVLTRVQAANQGTNEALAEVAKGMQEHAKSFSRWMGLFEQHQGPGETHTVRVADEIASAAEREIAALQAAGFAVDGPPPEALQFVSNMFR